MTIEEAITVIQKEIDNHIFEDKSVERTAKEALTTIISQISVLKSEMTILKSFYEVAVKERDYERSINRLTRSPSQWESDLL